jgi:hydroxyethylthiazole kinase-like uncharacterized protein yjeF
MTELVTSAEMQAIERDAIASGEVTGLGLMEIAGRGVVDAILRWRPGFAEGQHSVTVLCGPGNNGGDGYVVARLLRTRGWAVRVLGMGETARMPPDARAMRERWETMGAVEALSYRAFHDGEPTDLYVDAIFGTGLKRAPEGDLLEVLRYLSGSGGDAAFFTPRLVAVDAPSGLDLDSGRMLAGGDARPFSATVPLCSLTVSVRGAEGGACAGGWSRVLRAAGGGGPGAVEMAPGAPRRGDGCSGGDGTEDGAARAAG